jgi:hypothetical protein
MIFFKQDINVKGEQNYLKQDIDGGRTNLLDHCECEPRRVGHFSLQNDNEG